MVIDFADLKSIINQIIIDPLDHGLMLFEKSVHLASLHHRSDQLLVIKPYNPTCENMVIDFAHLIKAKLPKGVALYSLKLREMKTSYAEWFYEDNL